MANAKIYVSSAARQRGLLGKDGVGTLTPEPTGVVIWNANRGAISLHATMRGKAAHVGRQFEGVNAFERAVPTMARLLNMVKRFLAGICG